jgi:hypothetical protein
MADDKYKDPFMAISTVVIVLAALGVTFFAKGPLKVLRPVSELREPVEQVRARLWQDPFSAVIEYSQSQPKEKAGPKAEFFPINGPIQVVQQLDNKGSLLKKIEIYKNADEILVLGVMVNGGPYANDTESRIRYRVAVLSALQISGYVPVDSEYINVLRIQTTSQPAAEPLLLSNIIPYEWLERKSRQQESLEKIAVQQPGRVLLLWLNDDSFELQPLVKLNNLIKFLQSAGKDIVLPYKVIGPAGSNKLDRMVKELRNEASNLWFAHGMILYSPIATLPNYLFLDVSDSQISLKELEKQSAEKVQKLFKEKANIDFQRTIATDLELAYRLIDELKNRQIAGPKNHLVLISEWDTKYGRDLPKIFYNVIKEKSEKKVVDWVHLLSYLRGLDGIVPGLKNNPEQQQAAKDSAKNQTGNQAEKLMQEEPVGRSQLDYLRRLADSLYQEDKQLQKEGKGQIRAVGILGTDFYDKYLVQQAFKQRFPAAIFFTTDLDARLLHEAYNDSTRNLIVASGFDLEPPEEIVSTMAPSRLAPFRNSYQTAMFYSILKAFNCATITSAGEGFETCNKLGLPAPYLFEIGRQNAVNLDAAKTVFLPLYKQVLLITFLALAIFFVWVISLGFRKWLKNHLVFFLILLLLLTSCGYLFNHFVLDRLSEEPFSWSQGISIWPTEIIRLLALILTWVFFVNAKDSIRQSDTHLAAEFSLEAPPRQPCYRFISKGNKFCPPSVQPENGKILINDLWERYQAYNSGGFQRLRVLFITAVYFALPNILFFLIGTPEVPVRGTYSRNWDKVTMLITIFSFLFLTFFVFDTTRLLRWFIDEALGKKPSWKSQSKEMFVDKNSLAGEEMDSWMLIRLIAQRTEVINRLIFYPVIIWLMLFISRWPYFDNWTTPPALAVVIAMSAIFTWSCAIFLNRAAEKLRLQILALLSWDLVHLGSDASPNSARQSLVKSVIEEVKNIKQGAFTPFFQNPVVQVLFVPFGGVGGLTLLDFLNKLS